MIKRIYNQEEIEAVLHKFSTSLQSLTQGEEFRKEMAIKFLKYGNVLVVEKSEGDICGFVAYYMNDFISREAYISMIAVLPPYRKNGYGKSLLDSVIQDARKKEMKSVCLEVDKGNNKAIDFYRENGFYVIKATERSNFMKYNIMENEKNG